MTDFQPGDVVDGRYALEERIGLGGMAAVWRARDRSDGDAVVALKVLRDDFLKRNPKEAENNIRRFKREAEILKLMAGAKHVVQARAAGLTPEGDHYLVMELLHGEPLRNQIPRGQRKIGLRTFAWLARGLVEGLADIHARGVIHRDLSPDNIFVVRDAEGLPSPKFLDFGIGKGADGKLDQVTQLVTIMGKPQYFSPEQARGGDLKPASDVYSLAVILYEMATGTLPLDLHGLPLVASVKRIVAEPPKDLAATPAGARLPVELREVLMRGLAKKADERPTTAELAAALAAFSERLDRGEEFGEGGGGTSGDHRARTAASEIVPGSEAPITSAEPFLTPSAVLPREFKTGEMLGRFEVKRRLGRGGMGEVYRAWDTVLHRDVAIKVASKVEGEAAQKALLREARASSRLRSDHIVTVYDAGTQSGLPYIVMEYVEGRTLADIIEEEGPLQKDEFWKYAAGMVEGLAVAHENEPKVVHKDLKPGNILVAGSVAKIADFGLASFAAAGQKGESQLAGAAHGSVHTMSPEQAEGGRAIDERSDLYSLGCVFYMMTTGRPPFDGNEIAVLYQHQTQEPEPPSKKAPGFAPAELERVILKCLAKEPDRRYSSARELQRELEAIFQPFTATQLKPWHRRTPVLVSIVAGLAAVVLLLLFLKSRGEARTFEIRQVAGAASLGDGGVFVTRGDVVPVAYTARSGGELEIAVTPEGGTATTSKQTIRRAEGAVSFDLALPAVATTGDAEVVVYDVVLKRVDDAKAARSFRVVRDLKPPRIRVVAYGVEHDPAAGPIPLLSWRDATIVLYDQGGFRGREERRIDVADWTAARSEPAYSTTPGETSAERRVVQTTAVDAAGHDAAASIEFVRSVVRLAPETPDGAALNAAPYPFAAAFALEPLPRGFDPARDLADLQAAAAEPRADGRDAVYGTAAPVKLVDGRLVAATPPLEPTKKSADFSIALLRGGEPLRLATGAAPGKAGGPSYRYDAVPPKIAASADGAEAPAADGRAKLVLRGPGSVRERAAFKAVDEGARPVDRVRLFAKAGAGPETEWPLGADGWFRPTVDLADSDVVRLRAVDAAGNAAALEVSFERRLQRVGAAKIGALAAAADGSVSFVNRASLDVAFRAENLAADEALFVQVVEADAAAGAAPAPAPCREQDGEHRATIDLRTRGAPSCSRALVVWTGKKGGAPTETLARYALVFDEAAPQISVQRGGGRRVDAGETLSGPAFPDLVFRLKDSESGLDAATAAAPLAVDGPAKAKIEGTPEAGASEIVVRAEPEGGPADGVRRFKLTAVAKDRAGNVSEPFSVEIAVLPRPVSVLSFADDRAYGSASAAPQARKAVRTDRIPVQIRRSPELKGYAVVAASYVRGDDRPKETVIALENAAGEDGRVFVVDAGAPPSATPVEGRTVFLLRETATGATAAEPLHEVRWLLDGKAPELRLLVDGAPVSLPAAGAPLRLARLSSLVVVAEDDGGFPDVDAAVGAAFDATRPAPSRLELRLKDDGVDGRRELKFTVRDAAGNEAPAAFAVEPARSAPTVAEAKVAGGATGAAGVYVRAPEVDYRLVNETADAESVQATVKDAAGNTVFTSPPEPLPAGESRFKVAWPGADGGVFTVSLRHFRRSTGLAATPFDERKFVVDSTPPAVTIRRGGVVVTGDDCGLVGSTDELELVAQDAGSGVKAESYTASAIAPAGLIAQATLAAAGAEPRYKLAVPGATGRVEVEFVIFDGAGNAARRRLRFALPEAAVGSGPVVAPRAARRLSEYSAAEVAAAIKQAQEMSGVELTPIADGGTPVFYFSKTEVTQGQFRRFLDDYRKNADKIGETLRAALKRTPPKLEDLERFLRPGGDDLPVVGVSELGAAAFCAWLGGTLPTYDEWRGAAGRYRNPGASFPLRADGRPGLSTDKNFANYDTDVARPVTELAEGWFGLKGMAGNASEWVLVDRTRGVAGGSYRSDSALFVECLGRERPNPETDASVRGTMGIRVRWPAER